jgi:hypothetical protein
MIALRLHHTLGYGALGLGVLLTLGGAGVAVLGRGTGTTLGQSKPGFLGRVRLPGGRKARAFIVAAVIIGATLGTFAYGEYQLSSQSNSQFGLTLQVDSASEVSYPNGNVGVTVLVSAVGGIPPYSYFATWGDEVNQTSTTGNFTRTFGLATPLSTTLVILADSANNGLGSLSLYLPAQLPVVNGTVSTRTLTIVGSNGGPGQPGVAASSTQTRGANTFTAVVNASTPVGGVAASSTSTASGASAAAGGGSSSTRSQGFSVTVVVLNGNDQPIPGASVAFDGGGAQATNSAGRAVFENLDLGNHTVTVTSGSFDESFPLLISASSPPTQDMFVVV